METMEVFNLRVLYIEDEIDTIVPMARFLRRRFATVITANNGAEGWSKFNEERPDLVITDLLMPEYSGIELIKKIRDVGYQGPVIITSALQDIDSVIKTVDLGISKYIIKPVDMRELDSNLEKIGHEIVAKQTSKFDIPISLKKENEASIRHAISNILKKYSGKGPQDVKAFIGQDRIEVTCLRVRTTFEDTLYQNGKNIAVVEQCRRLFYQTITAEIEDTVSQITKTKVVISEISMDIASDVELIKLICD